MLEPQFKIDNEADLLKVITLRAEVRDVLTQAAKRFRDPHIKAIESFPNCICLTISEGF